MLNKKTWGFPLVIAVVFLTLAFSGCDNSFLDTKLEGTKWEANTEVKYDENGELGTDGSLSYIMKVTLEFTSSTQAKETATITKFNGDWSDELKQKMNGLLMLFGNLTLTYTYANKSGELIGTNPLLPTEKTSIKFTVNSGKKELTTIQEGEIEDGVKKPDTKTTFKLVK